MGQERPTSGLLAESTVERIHILDVIGLSRFEDSRVFAPDMLNGHALDVMEGVASLVEVVATGLGGLFGGDVVPVLSEPCGPQPLTASCVPGGKSCLVTPVLGAPPDVDEPLSFAGEGLGDVVGVSSDWGGDGGNKTYSVATIANKPKGLKVAKEGQMADRYQISMMGNGHNG